MYSHAFHCRILPFLALATVAVNILIAPIVCAQESFAPGVRDHLGDHDHLASDTPDGIEFFLTGNWDSRYVSEGRDNLAGEGLISTTFEASMAGFTFGTWYAGAPSGPYTELNLWVEYGVELGDFEIYAAYTHLRFPGVRSGLHDNEIGAGAAYSGLPWNLVPAVDAYYSFNTEGTFLEFSLSSEQRIGEWLTVTPAAVLGVNQGYTLFGHDGANHAAVFVEATIPLTENLDFGGYIAYNWSIDSDPGNAFEDLFLEDFFYGGVGFSITF